MGSHILVEKAAKTIINLRAFFSILAAPNVHCLVGYFRIVMRFFVWFIIRGIVYYACSWGPCVSEWVGKESSSVWTTCVVGGASRVVIIHSSSYFHSES